MEWWPPKPVILSVLPPLGLGIKFAHTLQSMCSGSPLPVGLRPSYPPPPPCRLCRAVGPEEEHEGEKDQDVDGPARGNPCDGASVALLNGNREGVPKHGNRL